MLYVNNKGQVVKLAESVRSGRTIQNHVIVSFDVNKLPQAEKHKYQGAAVKVEMTQVKRVKVAVKDGKSQSVSEHSSLIIL